MTLTTLYKITIDLGWLLEQSILTYLTIALASSVTTLALIWLASRLKSGKRSHEFGRVMQRQDGGYMVNIDGEWEDLEVGDESAEGQVQGRPGNRHEFGRYDDSRYEEILKRRRIERMIKKDGRN